MKKKTSLSTMLKTIIMLVLCMNVLSSCEKHDGTDYFKSKCTAELNGQAYIDQTAFLSILSPSAFITPWLTYDGGIATFCSHLGVDRESESLYRVEIVLYTDTQEAYLHEEHTIEQVEIEGVDPSQTRWEYLNYCETNRISYATVNGELVETGTFRILSYDKEKGQYEGMFTLSFSEGTLTGEFNIG